MLPLIPVCIFHGIEPKGCAGHITIHVMHDNNDIRIDVTDDGVGMSKEKAEQILSDGIDGSTDFFKELGVNNVHKRLQYQFGAQYGITIESELSKYTTMSIHIPMLTLDSDTVSDNN